MLAWVLMASGALTLPLISLSYLLLRLPARKAALESLFTQDEIIHRYLVMRGRHLPQLSEETDAAYRDRLLAEFKLVFKGELRQQYSHGNFVVPVLLAWFAAGLTVVVLVRVVFGWHLPAEIPSGVLYAMFGAFVWSLWMVIRAYTRNDLTPPTFYWVFFRYVLALGYGALAGEIFAPALANLGAFFAATLPITQLIRFLGAHFGTLAGLAPAEGLPKLTDIQGMDSTVIQRLDELGIHSAQDLAFGDPLELLLLSNFPPKVLIDWMDQAFLINYVGDKIKDLRVRGIRGAIELASLSDPSKPPSAARRVSIATSLGVSQADVDDLISNLYRDNHLLLIWHLWGAFEE